MYLLLKDSNIQEEYELIDDQTLSFKDKVLNYLNIQDINDLNQEYKLEISGDEVDRFKDRINQAKINHGKILLVSDYDCDGVLSLVIFSRILDYLKIDYNYYIPSRIKEGYGINTSIVERAKKYNFDLIVTLDNGVVAFDAISLANQYDIDMIIVDHHEFIDRPNVVSVIHPKYLNDTFSNLCTGGLSYMLSLLYYDDAYSNILAMITSLADVCPVLKVNRQILKTGLIKLNDNPKSYLPIYNLNKKNKYDYDDISFQIIPKINAISRMDHLTNVNILVKYFKDLVNDNYITAKQIEDINNLRKDYSKTMSTKALKLAHDQKDIAIVYDDSFLEGLCGLAANQLLNNTNQSCIVLSHKDNIYKGSGRAIDGFDIYEYFKGFKDEFISFGGHKKAIGLSFKEDKLDLLMSYVKEHQIKINRIKKPLIVIKQEDLCEENIDFLESLKPFGESLNEPLFLIVNPNVISKFLIKGLYPKYTLDSKVEAISFNQKLYRDDIKGFIGRLKYNSYGSRKINISIDEIMI